MVSMPRPRRASRSDPGLWRLVRLVLWCAVLLPAGTVSAATTDTRVVDAARQRDRQALRTALRAGADVNGPQPDGATALHWVAQWDDLESADALIRRGADVNRADDLGVTALSLASANGSTAMVQRLLKAGANPNFVPPTGETALMVAARAGRPGAVAALLLHGATVDARERSRSQTALMWAMNEGHYEAAMLLLAAGADVNARSNGGYTPLLFAARAGLDEGIRLLLAAGANVDDVAADGASALLLATVRGHVPSAQLLLDRGADPNADRAGFTALHWAAGTWETYLTGTFGIQDSPLSGLRTGKPELVRALLAHGANPNARLTKAPPRYGYLDLRLNLTGATPFLLAAMAADVEIMRLLVSQGADPTLGTTENTTPLMVAAGVGRIDGVSRATEDTAIEAVRLTLSLGGKASDVNALGNTALHGVAYLGWNRLIRFLVESGAHVNVVNKQRETPLLIAQGKAERLSLAVVAHEDTAELLRALGADERLGEANFINR